jgi:tetratricopeptide (TPR) repeat protein
MKPNTSLACTVLVTLVSLPLPARAQDVSVPAPVVVPVQVPIHVDDIGDILVTPAPFGPTIELDGDFFGKKPDVKFGRPDLNVDFDGLFVQAATPKPVSTPTVRVPPVPPMPPMPVGRNGPFYVGNGLYEQARASIDSGRYDRALDQLKRLIQQNDGKGDPIEQKVDAAHYWKAYSELKLQSLTDALATLETMQKRFGDSRWLRDARALEVEVRQASGQKVSPEAQADEDLKLLALRGLMRSDPDRTIPQVEQLLAGNSSVRLKENALFVLSQSGSPRATQIIANAARNSSNPDLQLRAVRYLGATRTEEASKTLEDVYRATSDQAVKRAVIASFAGSRSLDKLSGLVKVEKDVAIKRVIVRNVGSIDREKSGEVLRTLYGSEKEPELRREIISSLASQRNVTVLIALARVEKDPAMKEFIVSHISNQSRGSKEATDYLLELLK